MGNFNVDSHDHHLKKSEFPRLKTSIPNPFGSSKWHGDIQMTSPNYLLCVASSEKFEKSRLVGMQEAALHDSTLLEMGYQMTDCDSSMVVTEGDLLTGPHVGPTVGNPLGDGKDHKTLKPISLRELKVGKVHRGRILSGTLCCKTVKASAIMNVLEEDGTDDATRLVMSNSMHKSLTTAKSQLLYPKGAKISVQDPYLKRFADGMVGLLIEDPKEITFTFLPKESPPAEKRNRAEASKGMAGKVESRQGRNDGQESHAKVTRCVGPCRWKSLIAEQSASDETHPKCLRKILSTDFVDEVEDSKSSSSGPSRSEESLTTQESTPGVGAKEQTTVLTQADKRSLEIEELATVTVAQDGLDSSVQLDRSINSHSVGEEEKSPRIVAETGHQCGEVHQFSDNNLLIGCVQNKTIVPQNLSDKFELVGPSEDTCEGQELYPAEETCILKDAGAEQEEIDQTHEPLQEINKITSGDIITAAIEASGGCTKVLVDDNPEMNILPQGSSRGCSREVCEGSHGEPIENTKNEILATANEGGQFSPSATSAEKENHHSNSSRTPENSDADGTTADNHLSPIALRLLGNKHFAQQNWAKAIDLYTQATFKAIQDSVQESKENLSPNHEKIVGCGEPQKEFSPLKEEQGNEVVMDYSNRAEAWLRLHQYERAWADAERALSFDPNHLKSLFRKGRALLGLGDYRQALAHFEAANARTPFDKDVLAAIKLGRTADHQNRLGIYDLTDYYLRGRFTGEVPNCADYIGPVQVKANVGEKGRGLILTKSVDAGDLLLVSNPLAFWQPDHQGQSKSKSNILPKESTTQEGNPRVPAEIEEKLVEILLERAKVSSKKCQRLLALCHTKQEVCNQPAPSMDLFISGRQISPPVEKIETEGLDGIHLRQIIAQNVIDGNMVSTTLASRRLFHEENNDDASNAHFYGLWVLPSFINHSCIPNVSLVIIGKSIFVYASKDMDVGEELTCSYFNVCQPLPQRRELASRFWDFSCKCARCLLEAKFETSLRILQSLHTQVQPNPTRVMRFSPPSGNRILATDITKELQILDSLEKLGNRESSWLQASFTQLYITSSQDTIGTHGNRHLLYTALCAMEIVSPGNASTLEVGLLCRTNVERDCNHGKRTSKYKSVNQQLLRICKCIFGKHRTTVLQSLVEGFPPNVTRKVA